MVRHGMIGDDWVKVGSLLLPPGAGGALRKKAQILGWRNNAGLSSGPRVGSFLSNACRVSCQPIIRIPVLSHEEHGLYHVDNNVRTTGC